MWKFVIFWCTILVVSCNGFLSYAFNEAMKNYLNQINVVQPDRYGMHGQYGYPDVFSGKIATSKLKRKILVVVGCMQLM